MEDVRAVYTRPHDPGCPLVCLDETSKQLLAETRVPIPMKAGRPARFDYEYKRNGTANLFMMFAPLGQRDGLAEFADDSPVVRRDRQKREKALFYKAFSSVSMVTGDGG